MNTTICVQEGASVPVGAQRLGSQSSLCQKLHLGSLLDSASKEAVRRRSWCWTLCNDVSYQLAFCEGLPRAGDGRVDRVSRDDDHARQRFLAVQPVDPLMRMYFTSFYPLRDFSLLASRGQKHG